MWSNIMHDTHLRQRRRTLGRGSVESLCPIAYIVLDSTPEDSSAPGRGVAFQVLPHRVPSAGYVRLRPASCKLKTMKAAPFGYHRARSLPEAISLLSSYEGSARVLAGGQSLVPMMNMRLIRPDAVVDIGALPELRQIRADSESIAIGAAIPYSTLETAPEVVRHLPVVAAIIRNIGDRQIRNRGTIGGGLAHADPAGDMPLACLTLGAEVQVVGPNGARRIPLDKLYLGPYTTSLDPLEIMSEVVFAAPWPDRFGFAEMTRRHNDFAVVSVAAVASGNVEDGFHNVRVGLGGVNEKPVLAARTGQLASRTSLTDEDIETSAAAAVDAIDPPTDIRASAQYRRHVVPIYVQRVLRQLRSAQTDAAQQNGDRT